MDDLKITFDVKTLPLCLFSFKEGRKILDIQAQDSTLFIDTLYDFSDTPLRLCCEIKAGDRVEVIFLDFRIELYVNGILMDEEWPIGNRLFSLDDKITGDGVVLCKYKAQAKEIPSIISTFENAEGWRPKNGVFVGDCMPYVKNDEYHVLYLKDRHHHRSKWGMGAHQWEHISTKDFKVWRVHPMAVPITDKEECSICTGSWIQMGEVEHLYYTIRRKRGLPAIISRSISKDGYHFEKDTGFGFFVSEKYDGLVARDPKVIKGDDGNYHMLLTTVLVKENKGCLAHYISKDLESWVECDQPLYVGPNSDHPECPDYFKLNGKYYLVFSIRGRARYLVSDSPFEGFESVDDILIPCAGVPKCAQWGKRLIFTGFSPIDGYAGTMTFKAAYAKENGQLVFEEL